MFKKKKKKSPFQLYKHKYHKFQFEHSKNLPGSLNSEIPAMDQKTPTNHLR